MTNRIKKTCFGMLLLASSATFAQYTDEINANRPGESQSAFSVGQSVFQVETGVYGIKEKHEVLDYDLKGLGIDLVLRYGAFMENLEFIADVQYQFDQYEDALSTQNRNDFKQLTLGAKYLIYDPAKYAKIDDKAMYSWKARHAFKWKQLIPAVAVYAGTNLPLGDKLYTFKNDRISPKVMAITQHSFGRWVWINNFIYDKFGTDYPSAGIVSTVTRGFNEKWSGFVEFQGFMSDWYGDGIGRIGAAHLLNTDMQVDASFNINIKDTPSIMYAAIGFSWRFAENYREVWMPTEGDREEEFKAQKQKESEEKKMKKAERAERRKNRKKAQEEAAPTEEAPAPQPEGN
ncbi:MAG: transporter [Flavobacterium sp.]